RKRRISSVYGVGASPFLSKPLSLAHASLRLSPGTSELPREANATAELERIIAATHVPPTRNHARSLQNPRACRCGRPGGSLQGCRHAREPDRRNQGAPPSVLRRPGDEAAVRPRGANHCRAEPSEHLHLIRYRTPGRR